MKRIILLLVGVAVLGAGWYFVSPLFVDDTVDEGFDFLLADGQLDMDAVAAMPDSERQAMRAEIMNAAANGPAKTTADTMPNGAPAVLKTGAFVDADSVHRGSGTATVYELSAGSHVVRLEDLRVTNGPALVVYLASHPSPTKASDVTDGTFVNLGELKGNIGSQNYPVPDGVEVEDFGSVVIWCELFGVLFSPAALAAP